MNNLEKLLKANLDKAPAAPPEATRNKCNKIFIFEADLLVRQEIFFL